jgi:hypothetical protein
MKLYIETSVPNMLFHDDAPDLRRMTEEFFAWAKLCSDEFYTSVVTEDEIMRAPLPRRRRLLSALKVLKPETLAVGAQAQGLGQLYVQDGIIPVRFLDDALHVAVAVCHRLDVVVSWNMEHLVNVRRIERINQVNLRCGFPPIRIHTPREVMES